ncbi:carbonic anhydrase family protein [Aureivirga marina]|uniref:carbonic anhydrase family protein n=1 Tax=Aureivirga marina TaxID=1182451 RepID=UPI0018CABFC3|nr:carbonic anhydrase family protein [Aureivirga marina]
MADYITQTSETQAAITPQAALDMLKEGNARFLDKKRIERNYLEQVAVTATQQSPFAAILSCIDSRVPAEIVFDQGIGDIFSARVAGNFINTDILGSIEYACKVAGSKAVVVLGHSGCGAVKGACDHVELGNITPMLDNLMPAVDAVEETGDRSSNNADFVQRVVEKNVHLNIQGILERSEVLKEMYDNNEITIVGAVYDVASGKVSFL